jgi:hypothetical protein
MSEEIKYKAQFLAGKNKIYASKIVGVMETISL